MAIRNPIDRPPIVGYANACIVICLECAYKIISRRNQADFLPEYDADQDCSLCNKGLAPAQVITRAA